jgi:hypothetical protein
METFHGGLKEAKKLVCNCLAFITRSLSYILNTPPYFNLIYIQLELGVSRYPTDDRVWTAYEEYLKRDSAAVPLRRATNIIRGQEYDRDSCSSAHTERAIEELRGRRAEVVAAATRSGSSSKQGGGKQY